MDTIFKNKGLGFSEGTLIPPTVKSAFRDDLIRDSLEIVWSKVRTEEEQVLVGNIYVPPNNGEQLHTLDKVT